MQVCLSDFQEECHWKAGGVAVLYKEREKEFGEAQFL